MKYDIEPRDSEFVEEAHKRYKHILDNSPNDEAAKRAVRLCEKLLLYLIMDDPNFDNDFKLSYEELIELSVGLLEILKTALVTERFAKAIAITVLRQNTVEWPVCRINRKMN